MYATGAIRCVSLWCIISSSLLAIWLVDARLLLWDHSARMATSENALTSDWMTYSDGATTVVPFSEWTPQRMNQENKTSLFVHATFVVRDTATTMLVTDSDEDDEPELEGCLIDATRPPLQLPSSQVSTGGLRVKLRNRGTWSSVIVEIPGVAPLFVKTIVIPYAETDIDIQVDFSRNELSAVVKPRNRKAMESAATVRTPVTPLHQWPELLTFGADRSNKHRFSGRADWEIYSISMRMGHYTDPPITDKEMAQRLRTEILYRMNDPPIRFPKVLHANVFPGSTTVYPDGFFLRITFSFTITSRWRAWFDSRTAVPQDIDSPSLFCMGQPVNSNARAFLQFPNGLRVWVKVDPATGDGFVNVEVGNGEQYTHRAQIAWPVIQPAQKYNAEFMAFFTSTGAADATRLPIFRFATAPEDLTATNVYIEIPRVAAGRNYPAFSNWITAANWDFSSVLVGSPCRGLTAATSVLYNDKEFVVESIEFTKGPSFPADSIRLNSKLAMFDPPPAQLTAVNYALPGKSTTNTVLGQKRNVHLRAAEQKGSPRYAVFPTILDLTEKRPDASQSIVIAGEFAATSCSAYSWTLDLGGADDSAPTLLPLMSLPGLFTLSVDCARDLQLVLQVQETTMTHRSLKLAPNGVFRGFRVHFILPGSAVTPSEDVVELAVGEGSEGTIRMTLPQQVPRIQWGNWVWLGRKNEGGRVVHGYRGWHLKNVELSTGQFVPCMNIAAQAECATFASCGWVARTGCRPTAAGVTLQDSTTFAPTLSTDSPSQSPITATNYPTTADFVTGSPTLQPTTITSSPTHVGETPRPTSLPTASPTFPPWEWEYEEKTKSPTVTPVEEYEWPTDNPTLPRVPTVSPTDAPSHAPTIYDPDATPEPTTQPTVTFSPTNPPSTATPTHRTTTAPTGPSSPIVTISPSTSPTTIDANHLNGTANGINNGSGGKAAGIAVGTIFGLIALAGGIFFVYRRRNGGKQALWGGDWQKFGAMGGAGAWVARRFSKPGSAEAGSGSSNGQARQSGNRSPWSSKASAPSHDGDVDKTF